MHYSSNVYHVLDDSINLWSILYDLFQQLMYLHWMVLTISSKFIHCYIEKVVLLSTEIIRRFFFLCSIICSRDTFIWNCSRDPNNLLLTLRKVFHYLIHSLFDISMQLNTNLFNSIMILTPFLLLLFSNKLSHQCLHLKVFFIVSCVSLGNITLKIYNKNCTDIEIYFHPNTNTLAFLYFFPFFSRTFNTLFSRFSFFYLFGNPSIESNFLFLNPVLFLNSDAKDAYS